MCLVKKSEDWKLMIDSNYIWEIDPMVEIDSNNSKLHNVVLQLLKKRGIETPEDINQFLYPELDKMYDPMLMKDMDKAISRIKTALKCNEKITVYGDYDVDGITSCAIMMKLLRKLGGNVDYYVPSRTNEGYGLNKSAIEKIRKKGTNLIITVDNGISSFEEVEFAKELGIDMIITDHHEPREEIPDAVAVLNPKQPDCNYPFKELCGVGVVFKLAYALLDMDINAVKEYLDLAALGTVADIVPLLDENRIIVKNGLKKIETTTNKGVIALKSMLNLQNKPIDTVKIGFMIAPRLNAVGRISDADIAIELLLTEDENKARELAEVLENVNRERQNIESKILKQAEELIENNLNLDLEKVIVLSSSEWHPGVIGIVASRITEKYHRPSILIAEDGEEGQGSGRSISGFNLFEALDNQNISNLLVRYGGHSQAAGLTIKVKDIELFRKKINMLAKDILKEENLAPRLGVDLELKEEIDLDLAEQLELLEPFGYKNPKPLFISRNFFLDEIRAVGKKDKHLKLGLRKDGNKIDSIGFNFGNLKEELELAPAVDLAFYLEVNRWKGYVTPQLNIKDLKVPYLQDKMLCQIEDNYFGSFFAKPDKYKSFLNPDLSKYSNYANINFKNSNEVRKKDYIEKILQENRRILILTNTPYSAWQLLNYLHESNCDKEYIEISYNQESKSIKNNDIMILINPLADLKRVGFDDIVFYDTPFNISILKKQLWQVSQDCQIHLLLNKEDLRFNFLTCLKMLPDIDDIRKSYILLREMTSNKFIGKIDVREFSNFLRNFFYVDVHILGVINIFKIFSEIGIIEFNVEDDTINITNYIKPKKKLSLKASNTYTNLVKLKQEVLAFKKNFNNVIYNLSNILNKNVG